MLDKLRSLMQENNTDWFIVFSNDEHLSEYTGESDRYIRALSGFTGSAGTLLVAPHEAYLWTDSRYHIQAADQLRGSGIKLMKYGNAGVPALEDYLSEHIWEGQRVCFDLRTLSYDHFKLIEKKLGPSVEICDGRVILAGSVESMPSRSYQNIDPVSTELAGKSFDDKIAALRKKINFIFSNVTSYTYILSDLTSIMWLFNLRGSDISHVPVAYSYALINTYSATLYVSRKKLSSKAIEMLERSAVVIKEYSLFYKDLEDIATDYVIADRYSNNARILKYFDENGTYESVSDPELIPKAVKNASEIAGMEEAHIKDAKTMIEFIKYVKEAAKSNSLPDEFETGRILDEQRLNNGCNDTAFDTICAAGPNSAVVHYVANKETAKPCTEGLLLVDSGGQYAFKGTTDITRTISLGNVSDEEKRAYTCVLKGNLRLMDMIFPEGCEGTLLDSIAEQPLWENGYFCGHGIGHGVGCNLSVHESEARIARRTGSREIPFRPGVIVSDEPGVYMEGKLGVRLENLLLTVKAEPVDGHPMCRFVPLTLVPFDKESIDTCLLDKKECDILRRYYDLINEKVAPHLDEDTRLWLADQMKLNI